MSTPTASDPAGSDSAVAARRPRPDLLARLVRRWRGAGGQGQHPGQDGGREAALQALAREQQAMLDHDLIGMLRLRERRVLWANRGMQRIFGHAPQALVGQSMQLLHLDAAVFEAEGAAAYPPLLAGGSYRRQLQMRRADGSPVWIDASGVLLGPGSPDSLWLLADITPLKQAEAMRLKAADLEAENRQLLEAARLKSLFLANMSHELRTPLNAVIGYTTLLQREAEAARQQRQAAQLAQVGAAGRQLLQMIGDMLDYARAESDRVPCRCETVALPPLVHELVALQQPAAEAAGLRLHATVDPALHGLWLDPLRLRQVLLNLLSNALKFTPAGGAVQLQAQPAGEQWFRIEVADTGIGIAAADQPRLFTAFQQLSTGSTKRYAGAGLGLALVRRIVEAQGGQVGLRSAPGQGSVFHAVLPRRWQD